MEKLLMAIAKISKVMPKSLKQRIYVNTQDGYFVQCVSPIADKRRENHQPKMLIGWNQKVHG
jgi:hypothetical protein